MTLLNQIKTSSKL